MGGKGRAGLRGVEQRCGARMEHLSSSVNATAVPAAGGMRYRGAGPRTGVVNCSAANTKQSVLTLGDASHRCRRPGHSAAREWRACCAGCAGRRLRPTGGKFVRFTATSGERRCHADLFRDVISRLHAWPEARTRATSLIDDLQIPEARNFASSKATAAARISFAAHVHPLAFWRRRRTPPCARGMSLAMQPSRDA